MKNRLIYKFILSFAAATLVALLVMSYVIPKITLRQITVPNIFQTAPNLPESELYSMLSANISDVI